ncbi:MAG: hypothetical protein U9N51_11630 [Bacteroidota bacterium]|nr:hypothetical protein [Bacteroidota bacterium]
MFGLGRNSGSGRGRGQGTGEGRGQENGLGQGTGGGRGRNNGGGYSIGGYCVCAKCGEKVPHQQGAKCTTLKCPKCGHTMIREELLNDKKNK